MIISKIILNNFKVYQGRQTLHCDISGVSKPVILLGGQNGVGKTSLIEAIKLCLFGASSKSLYREYNSYQLFLEACHNSLASQNGEPNFGVMVEFIFTEMGGMENLTIDRSWSLKNNKYEESLLVRRNGKNIDFVSEEFWQEYINEVSPLGLSDLLYFDSEQFRRVPKYLENGFIDSLMQFWGLNNFRQLDDDISNQIYHITKKHDPLLANEYKSFKDEFDQISEELLNSEKKLVELSEEIRAQREKRSKISHQLTQKSGNFASKQKMIIKKREQLLTELRIISEEHIELWANFRPLLLAPNLCETLINQLEQERLIKNWRTLDKEVNKVKQTFLTNLGQTFDMEKIDEVSHIWDKTLSQKAPEGEILHDVSESRSNEIRSIILEVFKSTNSKLESSKRKQDHLKSDLAEINRALNEIRPGGASENLYSNLESVNEKIGALENEKETLQLKIDESKKRCDYLGKKIHAVEEKIRHREWSDKKVDLAERTQTVLRLHRKHLLEKRFKEFRDKFLQILNKLASKDDLINDMRFDHEKQILRFYKYSNNPVAVTDLSAGESELVALAILYAVSVTSDRKLPLVTDSPLNRLDAQHRMNFVKYFIPAIKNQIIFLSTDEEINHPDEYDIAPYLEKTFLIQYDHDRKNSVFIEGYFTNNA